jgi:hypothetical protein
MLHYGYWIRNVFPLSLMCPAVTESITRYCRCMPNRHLATNLPYKAQSLLYLPSGLAFKNYTICPQCIYVFCMDLRTNSNYFTTHYELIGLCNLNGVCLLRGTN